MTYDLTINTDEYGEETSWKITTFQTNEEVAKGKDYASSSTITESGCIPFNCYMFTIKDTFGDGLCCEHGNGSYSLSVNGVVVGSGGDEFKTRERVLFGTCRPIH
jgi:hypothetical protein